MTVVEVCDREGNTFYRDVSYKCPICRSKYDNYETAEICIKECVEEEYGVIEEVIEDPNDE
ncbi:MAG: hypothetical protein R3321_15590 [Nitrososphaeraceae archaeon]|nr:hypothetical protein [Nitrososphaeraceae archaeon]